MTKDCIGAVGGPISLSAFSHKHRMESWRHVLLFLLNSNLLVGVRFLAGEAWPWSQPPQDRTLRGLPVSDLPEADVRVAEGPRSFP